MYILQYALDEGVLCKERLNASTLDKNEWNLQKETLMQYNTSITEMLLQSVSRSQSRSSERRPRILVCITGQSSRLELESKVTNVLMANAEDFRINL